VDSIKFDTHEKLTQDVLKHFKKVQCLFLDKCYKSQSFRLSNKAILLAILNLQIKTFNNNYFMLWKEFGKKPGVFFFYFPCISLSVHGK